MATSNFHIVIITMTWFNSFFSNKSRFSVAARNKSVDSFHNANSFRPFCQFAWGRFGSKLSIRRKPFRKTGRRIFRDSRRRYIQVNMFFIYDVRFALIPNENRYLALAYSTYHADMSNPRRRACEGDSSNFPLQNGITNGAKWYSLRGGKQLSDSKQQR